MRVIPNPEKKAPNKPTIIIEKPNHPVYKEEYL
jgi:hypothetical protein